jgi:hypothetical protein
MTRETRSLLLLGAAWAAFVAPIALVLYAGLHPVHAGLGFVAVVCMGSVLVLHQTRPR